MSKPSSKRFSRGRYFLAVGLSLILGVAGYRGIRRWSRPAEPHRLGPASTTIVPGLSLLCGIGPSASYVVETNEGLVLVDTGLDPEARQLKVEMTRLGLNWKDIRAILLTHAHGDHSGGAEHLRSTIGAKIYAGEEDASVLKNGGPREAYFSTFYMPNQSPHPTKIDVELKGDEILNFGNVRFKAIATPGHTPGSMCYLMEKSNQKFLFGGDVITMLAGDGNSHPKGLRPLGTYSAYLSPRYRGDAKSSVESLRKLRSMPVPDLVLPGHPLSDPTPQSPHLTEHRWLSMLDQGIDDMETLLARYQTDGADFLDGHPKRLLPGMYYLGDYQGSAIYGFFVKEEFFLIDAPGNEGLYEFIQARLRELSLPATAPTAVLLTSCNAKDIAGLRTLAERSHAKVVAPAGGLSAIKSACPPGTTVLSAATLSDQKWFPVQTIQLAGRGSNPTAYVITWAGKQVLFSGRLPILFDHYSVEGLSSDLSSSRENVIDYLLSINRLESIKPDLWAPAVSAEDQNVHLYDNEWKYIISNNYRVARSILQQR